MKKKVTKKMTLKKETITNLKMEKIKAGDIPTTTNYESCRYPYCPSDEAPGCPTVPITTE